VRHDREELTLRAGGGLGLDARHALRLQQRLMLPEQHAELALANTQRVFSHLPAVQRLAQPALELLAMLHLRLEGARTLLENRDLEQASVGSLPGVALSGRNVRVMMTDRVKVLGVGRAVEVAHRVRAEQRELVRVREVVPQLLELECPFGVSVAPEQIDHLAIQPEDSVTTTQLSRGLQRRSDHGLEAAGLGQLVDHELLEGVAGVEQHELARAGHAIDVVPLRFQLACERAAVRLGRDHDQRLATANPFLEEVGHGEREKVLAVVELDAMVDC
jgi:hypothetical protein